MCGAHHVCAGRKTRNTETSKGTRVLSKEKETKSAWQKHVGGAGERAMWKCKEHKEKGTKRRKRNREGNR